MIVGNGDLASVLTDKENVVYFASGVSNSRENRISEFSREYNLLMQQPMHKHLIYFSTLSIYYGDSDYIRHKLFMEEAISRRFDSYTIVRIGNITWGKNPHTLINALTAKIQNNEPFEIKDEYRHILTKSDFLFWVEKAPLNAKHEMNITGKKMLVKDIVEKIKNNTLNTYLES
jgi:nucleoside-diphosphate-sugar epimerase